MYFKDKGNTDIDENLKYDNELKQKEKMKDMLIYTGLGIAFIIGIILIIVGISSYS